MKNRAISGAFIDIMQNQSQVKYVHTIANLPCQTHSLTPIALPLIFRPDDLLNNIPAVTVIAQVKAIVFLISWIAFPGLSPFGQVLLQFMIVWHRYRLMLLSSCAFLSSLCSSLLSTSQR